MKYLASLAVLALAACSASIPTGTASTPATAMTATTTKTTAADIESALAHTSATALPSSFATLRGSAQPSSAVTPDFGVEIHSVFIVAKYNGRLYKGALNGSCFLRYYSNGRAAGCGAYLNVNGQIKLVAGLYTGSNATGCLAATGAYQGPVHSGKIIPIAWHRTFNC